MQNMLEQGPDFWRWFNTTQFFVPLCSPNTCKDVFNPNCAEGLHFSLFSDTKFRYIVYIYIYIYIYIFQAVRRAVNVLNVSTCI